MSVIIKPEHDKLSNLKTKMTAGEMQLIARIEEVFKHSNRKIELFFQPNISGLRPDVICIEKSSKKLGEKSPGGIWIIEVKDWNLNNFNIKNNQWYFDNKYPKRSPIDQVQIYRNEIIKLSNELRLKTLINRKSPANYLVKTAIYFHTDTRININNKYTTILYKDFKASEMEALFESSKIESLSDKTYDNIKQYLGYLESDFEKPMFNGDSKQLKILNEFKSGMRRKKIIGPGGTGKTELLAQMVATELIEGKDVLVLTFNITLIRFLHDRIRNALRKKIEEKKLTIDNYHSFITKQIKIYDIDNFNNFNNFNNINLFETVKIQNRYDAIFIDEFQDYKSEWGVIVEKYFLNDNGSFVVFGDANQNIYKRELVEKRLPKVSILGRPNELNINHRSINVIAELSKKYQQEFLLEKYDMPRIDSEQLSMFDFSEGNIYVKKEKRISVFFEEVNQFLKSKEIKPNEVSIVGYTRRGLRNYIDTYNECCLNQEGMSARRVSDYSRTVCTNEEFGLLNGNQKDVNDYERTLKINFKPNHGTTKAITVNSLKGSETEVALVILEDIVNIDLVDNDNLTELLYTTITRAKKYLFFYYNESVTYPNEVIQFIHFISNNK